MTRIVSVSTGRSDHGILTPVWAAIDGYPELELKVLFSGMQVRDDASARAALPAGIEVLTVGEDLGGGDGAGVNRAAAKIMAAAGEAFSILKPDIVMVMGDRLDMFPVAVACLSFNLPLAHLHGGEQTLGAIDDRIRHATTKLAHVHFPATADAASRINQMGEEAWRITITGAPGLDALNAVPVMTAEQFAAAAGLKSANGLLLVTLHPETNSQNPSDIAESMIGALKTTNAPILFTTPNSDPGGKAVLNSIRGFVAERPNAVFRENLGTALYANAMRHSAMMIGNSSSGLIEAPIFNLPVINIGSRQQGRLRGNNVIDVSANTTEIAAAIASVKDRAKPRGAGTSPYGDGHAAQRIAKTLAALPPRQRLLNKRIPEYATQFTAPWETSRNLPDKLLKHEQK